MRQKWIDNAKGIAMLCVIVGHVSGGLEKPWDFQFVYGFHLVIFFLLSGYTLKKKTFDREYVNDKFSKLMIPYFYTCIAIMIMDVCNSYIWNHDGSLLTITYIVSRDILRSFFASGAYTAFGTIELGTRIGAIWFLPAMFFAVIMFQGLLQVIDDRRKLGLATVAIALMGVISARFIWLPFSIQSGMMATFYIWIGYAVRENGILGRLKWYHYIIAQVIFLVGIFDNYSNVGFVVANANDLLLSTVVGLCGCMLVYLIATHMEWSILLSYVGKNSLLVLCAHLFSLEVLGVYVEKGLDMLELNGNLRVWTLIVLEVIIAVAGAFIIDLLRTKTISIHARLLQCKDRKEITAGRKRDVSLDVARGIFIISMLIGYFSIDSMLRNIIYSCHMIAFVFFSGYFYKKEEKIFTSIAHMFKTLLVPYIICVTGIIILNYKNLSLEYLVTILRQYIIGMSFSRRYFTDVASVGPIYFILLLFVVRVVYLCLDQLFKNDRNRALAVLGISFLGMKLGQEDCWLPWSIDIACYAMVFYQLGIYAKKYEILELVRDNHMIYFILTPIWAYMIYLGGMELAIRNYGQYGLVVIGALSGTLVVYKLSVYISQKHSVLAEILGKIGQYSIIVLIIHTMLGNYICGFVSVRFSIYSACYMIISCVIQVLLVFLFVYLKNVMKYIFLGSRLNTQIND